MATTIVKTKKDKSTGEQIAYSEAAGRNNAAIVEYCRTSMAALSGSTAGLLGLTGLSGFVFYFITAFVLWLMILMKAGYHWKKYMIKRRALLTNGLFGGLFIQAPFQLDHFMKSWIKSRTILKLINKIHMFYVGHFFMVWSMYIEVHRRFFKNLTEVRTIPEVQNLFR